MLLNHTKPSSVGGRFGQRATRKETNKKPKLDEYIEKRDYTGAIALLEFDRRVNAEDENTLKWLGYSCAHLGNYRKALEVYETLLKITNEPAQVHLMIACCLYYLQSYDECEEHALKGEECALQTRILFHTAHKQGDESKLMVYHQKLTDTKEDQLSLAAIHYLRNHFTEATDIYKRLLLQNRDELALNVYVAMCYFKLDYYDVSLEILQAYLQNNPDSAVALNLKACNHFRLFHGKAAETELKVLADRGHSLQDNDLIRHNLVVFRNGQDALQVLPNLIEFLPEARLNLVIYHLREGQLEDAYELIKDLDPSTPSEYILKGVVYAAIGQKNKNRDDLKKAQHCFQVIGASITECDTIPGRQCMASCFFLLKQFEDVNIYLHSIKSYSYAHDDFNHNYGISLAATGQYAEAEETLQQVQSDKIRNEYCYLSHLARCFIMVKKPRLAWELYLKMDTSNESFKVLELIANDCYKMGLFYYSAKAFDVLERIHPDPEFWEGKRGACVGVFQMVVAGMEPKESLMDVLTMLRNTSNPQVEYFIRMINKWSKENGIKTDI